MLLNKTLITSKTHVSFSSFLFLIVLLKLVECVREKKNEHELNSEPIKELTYEFNKNDYNQNKSANFFIQTIATSTTGYFESNAQTLNFQSNAQLFTKNNGNFDLINNFTQFKPLKLNLSSETVNKLNNNKSNSFDQLQNESKNETKPFAFMCIVYTLSTLSAIILNLVVILVYFFGRSARTDLSIFLINLAIADFVMSTVCMPFTFAQALLDEWIFGEIMCPIVLFKQVLAVSLSIYTMVAIGVDRYYAIKCPLKNHVNGHKKSKLIILYVWILSIGLASVQLFVARAIEYPNEQNSTESNSTQKRYVCNEKWTGIEQKIYTVFNLFAVYLIPVVILAYTYTCIGCILKQSTHPGNSDATRDMNYNKSKKKLPLHMFVLIKDFTPWLNELNPQVMYFIFTGSHWLAMANCFINPFIYGYSNKKFRADVCSLITCVSGHGRSKQSSGSFRASTFQRMQKSEYYPSHNLGEHNVNTYFLKTNELRKSFR